MPISLEKTRVIDTGNISPGAPSNRIGAFLFGFREVQISKDVPADYTEASAKFRAKIVPFNFRTVDDFKAKLDLVYPEIAAAEAPLETDIIKEDRIYYNYALDQVNDYLRLLGTENPQYCVFVNENTVTYENGEQVTDVDGNTTNVEETYNSGYAHVFIPPSGTGRSESLAGVLIAEGLGSVQILMVSYLERENDTATIPYQVKGDIADLFQGEIVAGLQLVGRFTSAYIEFNTPFLSLIAGSGMNKQFTRVTNETLVSNDTKYVALYAGSTKRYNNGSVLSNNPSLADTLVNIGDYGARTIGQNVDQSIASIKDLYPGQDVYLSSGENISGKLALQDILENSRYVLLPYIKDNTTGVSFSIPNTLALPGSDYDRIPVVRALAKYVRVVILTLRANVQDRTFETEDDGRLSLTDRAAITALVGGVITAASAVPFGPPDISDWSYEVPAGPTDDKSFFRTGIINSRLGIRPNKQAEMIYLDITLGITTQT